MISRPACQLWNSITNNPQIKGRYYYGISENIAALIKVKTAVTFAVMAVFTVLALRGDISPDNAMIIISMVVSFYFGTQAKKD